MEVKKMGVATGFDPTGPSPGLPIHRWHSQLLEEDPLVVENLPHEYFPMVLPKN